MTKIFETEKEIEVLADNGSSVAWVKCENPQGFSVFRDGSQSYVRMGWNDLTLDEQKAVEKFN